MWRNQTPRHFNAVCEALGLPPNEVLSVGDGYATDVIASRATGLHAIHLDRNTHWLSPTHDRIATSTELSDVVTRTHPQDTFSERGHETTAPADEHPAFPNTTNPVNVRTARSRPQAGRSVRSIRA